MYFIHLTDLHLRRDESWPALEKFVLQVNNMRPRPAFVVNGGDTVWGNLQVPTPPDELRPEWQRYQRIISSLSVPIYSVVGNHDTAHSDRSRGVPGWGKELFEEYCGPRFQSFDWQGWRVITLDQWAWPPEGCGNTNEMGHVLTSEIDDDQLQWLSKQLSLCRSGDRVLFLTHRRLHEFPLVMSKLSPMLREDLRYVELAGCDHLNSHWAGGNWHSYTTASFCGSWWDGPCIDLNPSEQFPHQSTFRVVAHRGRQHGPRPQCAKHRRHAARPAQPVLLPADPQHGDRRLGTDPLHVAEQVAVEHDVADDQDPRRQLAFQQQEVRIGHPCPPPSGARCWL